MKLLLGPLWWLGALIVAFVLFGLAQLVPYRVDNPPVAAEPRWDSAQTRTLVKAACFDCHSNESHPYAWEKIAPLSWWIANHVKEGRSALNFSEWGTPNQGNQSAADDVVESVRENSMPPGYYTWLGLHGEANLTAAQRQQLADGLTATLAADPGTPSRGGG
jgi:mono/diheme cytochrome c family protein